MLPLTGNTISFRLQYLPRFFGVPNTEEGFFTTIGARISFIWWEIYLVGCNLAFIVHEMVQRSETGSVPYIFFEVKKVRMISQLIYRSIHFYDFNPTLYIIMPSFALNASGKIAIWEPLDTISDWAYDREKDERRSRWKLFTDTNVYD